MTAAEVYRTGRSARIEEMDWSAVERQLVKPGVGSTLPRLSQVRSWWRIAYGAR